MLVKLKNGVPVEWPVNENRIRHEYPNVSFPRDPTKINLGVYGYAKFKFSDPQSYDAEYQTCTEVTPVLHGDTYIQTWAIANKFTPEERKAYDDKKEADTLLGLKVVVREQRNALLTASDWTQVPDAPVDQAAWRTYRQALRDVTTQSGFPHEVTWPVKPE